LMIFQSSLGGPEALVPGLCMMPIIFGIPFIGFLEGLNAYNAKTK